MYSKLLALSGLALGSAQTHMPTVAPTTWDHQYESLPDCTCKSQWRHNEYLCNSSNPNNERGNILMNGCPSIETLQLCEYDPQQSWCETNEDSCKQQMGFEGVGEGWAYCDPREGVAELPICTCKSSWKLAEENCASNPLTVKGCPTPEQIKQCVPDLEDGAQPWCDTNEVLCREQENVIGSDEEMVGYGWSYCNSDDQYTELPACECESSWVETNCTNGAPQQSFRGCPTVSDISKCYPYEGDEEQTYCKTTANRCREQTFHVEDASEDMINDTWAYCSPTTQEAEWPNCQCLETWTHESAKCEENPLVMHGCPSKSTLAKCDYDAINGQNWCDTTFQTCKQQNYESDDKAWSYCTEATGMGDYAECECMDSWTYRDDGCNPFSGGTPMKMRGCPSLEQVQQCDPDADQSWCNTKDMFCKEQVGNEQGEGWVACDPSTQWALDRSEDAEYGGVIATSVAVTFLICALIVVGLLYAYRKYMHGHKDAYAELSQMKLVDTYSGGP